jgi:hypothetical protein
MSSVTKSITFLIETCIYSAVFSSTVVFLDAYFSAVIRLPAMALMFIDAVVWMVIVNSIVLFIYMCYHTNSESGFQNNFFAEISKGFCVMCSLLWVIMLLCTTSVNVPFITALPGSTTSASLIPLSVVLGFGFIVPLLATMCSFVAVPVGGSNSLLLNGPAVGAASLLFLVLVAVGNGGVTKCPPFSGDTNRYVFYIIIVVYWISIVFIELAMFFKWNPVPTGLKIFKQKSFTWVRGGVSISIAINGWRIVSCVVDVIIVLSALAFCKSEVVWVVGLALLLVVALHVPMVIDLKFSTIKTFRVKHGDEVSSNVSSGITVASFERPLSQGAVFDGRYRGQAAFPFNNTGRVLATMPRQRRVAFPEKFY